MTSFKKISVLFLFLALLSPLVKAETPGLIEKGKQVKMNYILSVDGKVVENTHDTQPMSFTFGSSNLLPSFEEKLKGLKTGAKDHFELSPAEGYGEVEPKAVLKFDRARFDKMDVKEGMIFSTNGPDGQPLQGRVLSVKDGKVTLDFNHPLAGKTLQFDIEILEVI